MSSASGSAEVACDGPGRFAAFEGVAMLRFDVAQPSMTAQPRPDASSEGDMAPALDETRTYYVTPFVTDGERLYVFDEPGERSEMLEELLLGNQASISSRSTGAVVVRAVGRKPTAAEASWARDACSARFHYDQALQDIAQLGALLVFD